MNANMELVKPEEKAVELYNSIKNDIKDFIEMSPEECTFLFEMINKYKPKKCLELGVSRGGSSLLILNALKNIEGSKLYSIDFNTDFYKDPSKKTGFLVDSFPELKSNWTLKTGNMAYKFLDEIGNDIDFCLIDTVHSNPGELLDFLMVLPYLKEDAVIVFHDTNLQARFLNSAGRLMPFGDSTTTNLCMSAITGYKFVQGNFKYPELNIVDSSCHFPNIGAVQINKETRENIFNVFNLLTLHWCYLPDKKNLEELTTYINTHYGEFYSDYFHKIAEYQTERMKVVKNAKHKVYNILGFKIKIKNKNI